MVGHLIVTLPYTVRLVSISVRNLDPHLERAVQNLGATPLQTFWRATLPFRIFNCTEYNFDPAINAVSTIFVVLALVLLYICRLLSRN
ncbi:MAG: hypothetical protein HYY95_01155 [Candidatus Rokubacteria bacterium]|nr:hypothetical protein [Candidatus Rokubacteria bacterium]